MSAPDLFRRTFGRPAEVTCSAPGRVNLIGEHTDYSGGLVLPFAIDARAVVAGALNRDRVVRVVSAQRPGEVHEVAVAGLAPSTDAGGSWSAYPLGVVWSLVESDLHSGGVDLALDSAVPVGAGLSSSAAVECATAMTVSVLDGVPLTPIQIARLALRAENDFVGVPCGPMDQTASAASEEGAVLRFDTRSGAIEHIPFDPAADGLAVLVIDTQAHHALADGEYAKRRADCEEVARRLGVRWLREVGVDDLPRALRTLDDDTLARRLRHVVGENDRVDRTVALLRAGDVAAIGPLLTASHDSLRDDYEVSSAELDVAVRAALGAGAHGARMTGGGFGGSIIALVDAPAVDAVASAVAAAFAARGWTAPAPRVVQPAAGARRD